MRVEECFSDKVGGIKPEGSTHAVTSDNFGVRDWVTGSYVTLPACACRYVHYDWLLVYMDVVQ